MSFPQKPNIATTDYMLFWNPTNPNNPGTDKEIFMGSVADFIATYITPTAGDWKLLGNAGTTAGTNFVGTTDNVDLVFKRQSVEKFRILASTVSFSNIGAASSVIFSNTGLTANRTYTWPDQSGTIALTSDIPSAPPSWELTGNAGTTPGTDFIGTTDAQDLVFKTNSAENVRIVNTNGYVGIGVSPMARLDVKGTSNDTGSLVARYLSQDENSYWQTYSNMANVLVSNYDGNLFSMSTTGASGGFNLDGATSSMITLRSGGTIRAQETATSSVLLKFFAANIDYRWRNDDGTEHFLYKQSTKMYLFGLADVDPTAKGEFRGDDDLNTGYSLRAKGSAAVAYALSVQNDGCVGIGTNAPTGLLHIAAGTTTIPNMKWTIGALLTSPASYSWEINNERLYYTPNSTPTRHQVKTRHNKILTAAGPYTMSVDDEFIGVNQSVAAAITVNLPASPEDGDEHTIADLKQDAGTNNITVGRNGNNIEGVASDIVMSTNGISLTFRFLNSYGWKII